MQLRNTDDKSVLSTKEEMPNIIRSPDINDYKAATTTKEGIKIVSEDEIQQTFLYASQTVRHRHPILLNNDFNEVPQRFINCLDHRSYVRPHMHTLPNQWELMSWLSGEVTALIFNQLGILVDKILMNNVQNKVIEIPLKCYHSFITNKQGAYLEVRNCSYNPLEDRVYADWSPEEFNFEAEKYLQRLSIAEIGDDLSLKF